jgi:hypothetical protein
MSFPFIAGPLSNLLLPAPWQIDTHYLASALASSFFLAWRSPTKKLTRKRTRIQCGNRLTSAGNRLVNLATGPGATLWKAVRMILSSYIDVRWVRFAVATILLLCQRTAAEDLAPKDFKDVKSLKGAVEVVKARLQQDGKPEYAALLSEDRVRDAIRTAIQSCEAFQDDNEKRIPGTKEYFDKEVKPVCLRIAEKAEWPEKCSFFSFYTLIDKRDGKEDITYDGLGLRLRIETPNGLAHAFALPILDLFFGRWTGN